VPASELNNIENVLLTTFIFVSCTICFWRLAYRSVAGSMRPAGSGLFITAAGNRYTDCAIPDHAWVL